MSIEHVPAYMNHGRWIADCPGVCVNGAVEIPGRECDECRVRGVITFVVPVVPLDADKIEEAMILRPEAQTRNWQGETVEKLHAETRDYLWPGNDDNGDPLTSVGQVRAAAKRATEDDLPRYADGRPALHIDFGYEDSKLGEARQPVRRYRGRSLWKPPNLPEGWSEGGVPVPSMGGDA